MEKKKKNEKLGKIEARFQMYPTRTSDFELR